MLAILRKELKTYYSSLFAYIYYFIFFLVAGILFTRDCLDAYSTEFGYSVLQYCVLVVVVMIPFCTMRIFSQERRQKTDQLLFTSPVSTFSILAGKYVATAIYVLVPILLSFIYPLILMQYGYVSGDFLFCSYLGGILLTLALLGVGIFVSTLTSNAILSAVITYGVYLILLLGRILEGIVSSDRLFSFLHGISIYDKYYDMISGIVRSGDIAYFIVICVFFFVLTWISLLSRRQSKKKTIGYSAVFIVAFVISSSIFLHTTKVYDFTPEKLLVLSDATKENVSNIKNDTSIYYLGSKSQANATYVELLNAYQDLSSKITVDYIPLDDDEFMNTFLANIPNVNEASIVVATENRFIYLDSEHYISTVQTGSYSYSHMLEIEDQLTSAILYCNTQELKTIARITGHGEGVIGDSFRNLLNLAHYEFKNVNLIEEQTDLSGTTLSDAAALFIYSPQEDYSEEEISQLEDYMEKGGKLIVSIDPLNEDLTNLFEFLSRYGLLLQSGVVIEGDTAFYVLDTNYYLSPYTKESDFTKDLIQRNLRVITYTSKGIARNGGSNGYECTDVLLTSNSSFSKVDNFDNLSSQGENDRSGPFSVASIAKKENEGTLFLIASDIMFTDEADSESGGANSRFFSEMIKSVVGNDKTVWIKGKDVNTQIARFDYSVIGFLKALSIVLIPAVILVFGIFILISRKKNFGWKLVEKRRTDGQKKKSADDGVGENLEEDKTQEEERK